MTTKQAADLYARAGRTPPPDIASPAPEYVRDTRRKIMDGIWFRSTLEANCYQLLKSWEAAGMIRNLKQQPKFVLQQKFRRWLSIPIGKMKTERAITYKADFQFERIRRGVCPGTGVVAGWETVVVEAKGFRTQAYELRRKMFLARFPELRYEIWTKETVKGLQRG